MMAHLTSQVFSEAALSQEGEKATLVDLLNAFDSVLSRQEQAPPAEVANAVYKNLLVSEKQKAYDSIKSIQSEIADLQEYQSEVDRQDEEKQMSQVQDEINFTFAHNSISAKKSQPDYLTSSRNIAQTNSLTQRAAERNFSYDFVDSVPQTAKNKQIILTQISDLDPKSKRTHFTKSTASSAARAFLFSQNETQRIDSARSGQTALTDRIEFEQTARGLDNLLPLQTNESFVKRCSKLANIQKYGFNYHEVLNQKQETLNADLVEDSKLSFGVKKSKFPKLVLTQTLHEDTSSSDELKQSSDKAIDSDKALVFSYYCQKLLKQAWRSMHRFKIEQQQLRFMIQIASQRHHQNLEIKTLRALRSYAKTHKGYARRTIIADAFFRARVGKVYLRFWRHTLHEKLEHDSMLSAANQDLIASKKLRLFKNWKATVKQLQMYKIQRDTAEHVSIRRLKTKCFFALRAYARHQIKSRYYQMKTTQSNRKRLLFKGLKAWQQVHLAKLKKIEMSYLADQLRQMALRRQVMFLWRLYVEKLQHSRSLKACAIAYRQLSLQKQFMQVLKLNVLVQYQKREKLIQADCFNQKFMKKKLLSFLHHSNLEFIRHSVLAQEVMRRKKTRTAFMILQAYWHQNKAPVLKASGNSFYLINLWISLESTPMTKSLSRSYKAQFDQSKAQVKLYKLSQIFSVWKRDSTKFSMMKRKQQNKFISKYFNALAGYSSKRAQLKRKLIQYKKDQKFDTLRKVVDVLSLYAQKKLNHRQMVAQLQDQHTLRRTRLTWLTWRTKYQRLTIKRDQKQISQEMAKKRLFRFYLGKWTTQYRLQQKKVLLKQLQKHFTTKVTKQKLFSLWLKQTEDVYSSYYKACHVHNQSGLRLLGRCLKSLKTYSQTKKAQRQMVNQFQQLQWDKKHHLVFDAWRAVLPELKQKKILFTTLKHDYEIKLVSRVFKALKTYKTFKIEQKVQDELMARSVRSITARRFFKRWQSLQHKRLGLCVFADLISKLQQKMFFKKERQAYYYSVEVNNHMFQFKNEKLQECAFNSLKRYTRRRDWAQEKHQQIQELRTYMGAQHFFKQWILQTKRNQWERKVADYCVFAIRTVVMQKYFDVLKGKQVRASKGRILASLTKQRQARLTFDVLKHNLTQAQRLAVFKKKIGNSRKQAYLKIWMRECQEQLYVFDFMRNRTSRQIQKIIKSWKQYTELRLKQEKLVKSGQANSNFYTASRVFQGWQHYVEIKMNRRHFTTDILQKQRLELTTETFGALKQFYLSRQDLKHKQAQVGALKELRLARLVFSKMRAISSDKTIRYKTTQKIGLLFDQQKQKDALQNWLQFVEFERKFEAIAAQLTDFRNKQIKNKIIRMLKDYAVRRQLKRERVEQVFDYVNKKNKVKAFAQLIDAVSISKVRQAQKNISVQYYNKKVTQKSLKQLYKYSQKKILLRQLLAKGLQSRLLPKSFVALKQYALESKLKQQNTEKALGHQNEKLLHRAFKAMLFGVVYYANKRKQQEMADAFYEHHTFDKFMKKWSIAQVNLRSHEIKRQILQKTIAKVYSESILKLCFSNLKLFNQSEGHRLFVIKAKLNRLKAQKCIIAWQSFLVYQKDLTRARLQIEKRRHQKVVEKHFATWFCALTDNLKIQLFEKRRVVDTVKQCFESLQMNVNYSRASYYVRQDYTSKLMLKVLQRLKLNALINKEHQTKIKMMREQLQIGLKSKVILALKYHCLTMKGVQLIKNKQQQKLLAKSLDALRYFAISQRVGHKFRLFKQERTKQYFFQAWIHSFQQRQQQKEKLNHILTSKYVQDSSEAFFSWKRNAYRHVLLERLQDNLLLPDQVETAYTILIKWRQYTRFKSQKQTKLQQFQQQKDLKTKQELLGWWYQQTMERVPARLMAEKLSQVFQQATTRKVFDQLLGHSTNVKELDDAADQILTAKTKQKTALFFSEWRRRFETKQIKKYIADKHTVCEKARVLLAWKQVYAERQGQRVEEDVRQKMNDYAANYYEARTVKRVFERLLCNYAEGVQYKQAIAYNNGVLAQRALNSIQMYAHQMAARGHLNKKCNQFKRYRQLQTIDLAFKTMLHKAQELRRERQIVGTFEQYRRSQMKAQVFDFWLAITLKNSKLKSISKKANLFFNQRREYEVKHQVFEAFKEMLQLGQVFTLCADSDARRMEAEEMEILDERAMEFRAEKLQEKALTAWKLETNQNLKKQQRSKMYTIFSAWKFYTKERVLLKKYLRECGESEQDMSMLTTLDLRKNAEKFKDSGRISSVGGVSQMLSSYYGPRTTDRQNQPSPRLKPHIVNSESQARNQSTLATDPKLTTAKLKMSTRSIPQETQTSSILARAFKQIDHTD